MWLMIFLSISSVNVTPLAEAPRLLLGDSGGYGSDLTVGEAGLGGALGISMVKM